MVGLKTAQEWFKAIPSCPCLFPLIKDTSSRWSDLQSDPSQFTGHLVPTTPVPFSNSVVIYALSVDIQLITLQSAFIQYSTNIRGFLNHLNHTIHQNVHHWEKRPCVGFLFFFLLYSIFRIFQMSLLSFFKEEKPKKTLKDGKF